MSAAWSSTSARRVGRRRAGTQNTTAKRLGASSRRVRRTCATRYPPRRSSRFTTCSAARSRLPKQPPPQPDPPTPDQASQIVTAAWGQDTMWGTLVWLVMVTGLLRAELLALRWSDVDLDDGYLAIRRNYVRAEGRPAEKDTKNHRLRRIALDPATVDVLTEQHERYKQRMADLGVDPQADALLFSYEPQFDKACNQDGITHRYQRMYEGIGLDSHLHALRHYSATELLTAGVDLRTVAGRLGHGGGGATTLRVYAAWKSEAAQPFDLLLRGACRRRPGSPARSLGRRRGITGRPCAALRVTRVGRSPRRRPR